MHISPLVQALMETALSRNDTATLSELLRVSATLAAAEGAGDWCKALLSERVQERIAWIMENTLNATLYARLAAAVPLSVVGPVVHCSCGLRFSFLCAPYRSKSGG